MKLTLLALLIVMFVASSFAADGKPVSYKSGDEIVSGILYAPPGKRPFPALVVIHEWWGLNDWVKDEASKLADQGYAALAIDLYRGKVATTPDEAHQIMRGVPEDRANRDLLAATAYLASQKNIEAKRIGSVGWCMGGGYSLDLAISDPTLKATVINYAPILGIFGGQDKGITKRWGRQSTFTSSPTPDMPSRIQVTRPAIGPKMLPKPGTLRQHFWRST